MHAWCRTLTLSFCTIAWSHQVDTVKISVNQIIQFGKVGAAAQPSSAQDAAHHVDESAWRTDRSAWGGPR
jgi:hypothetical protein